MGLTTPGVRFDKDIAQHVREALESYEFTEQKMFGGICFKIRGHMCCGVDESDLFVRLDEPAAAQALRRQHAAAFDIGGQCSCGDVRYTTNAEPQLALICQCSQCQRISGSGHRAIRCAP